jgi:shikimate kinase
VKSVPTIVITGFMGSGKTAVARSLGAQLRLGVIDLDQFITETIGRTPAQIIGEDGERAFRMIENEALKGVLTAHRASVIALGGGAWIEQANRTVIEEHNCITIWLDTPFAVCWERIQTAKESRPLGKTEEQARELFERRLPIYQLANLHVKVLKNEAATDLAARLRAKVENSLNT